MNPPVTPNIVRDRGALWGPPRCNALVKGVQPYAICPSQSFFSQCDRGNIESVHLIREFTPVAYDFALASWKWLGITDQVPRFASCFGDIFLESPTGWWFLDTVEGTLEVRWPTMDDMFAELESEDGRAEYLLEETLHQAEGRGMSLADDEVFAFLPPPAVTGSMAVENLAPLRFAIAASLSGRIHQELRLAATPALPAAPSPAPQPARPARPAATPSYATPSHATPSHASPAYAAEPYSPEPYGSGRYATTPYAPEASTPTAWSAPTPQAPSPGPGSHRQVTPAHQATVGLPHDLSTPRPYTSPTWSTPTPQAPAPRNPAPTYQAPPSGSGAASFDPQPRNPAPSPQEAPRRGAHGAGSRTSPADATPDPLPAWAPPSHVPPETTLTGSYPAAPAPRRARHFA